MLSDEEMTVFSRLRQAVADAVEEESIFAFDVTSGDDHSTASYREFSDWVEEVFRAGLSLRLTPEMKARFKTEIAIAFDENDEAFGDDGPTTASVARVEFVKPLLDNHLAKEGVERIEAGAERFVYILDYLIEADLQPKAQQYLSSVARLYIWGFFGELIILARSALQLALDEELGAFLPKPRKKGRTPRLDDLIRAAEPRHLSRLNASGIEDADFIKEAGDHAVHKTMPSTEDEAKDILMRLGRVLEQLFASRTRALTSPVI